MKITVNCTLTSAQMAVKYAEARYGLSLAELARTFEREEVERRHREHEEFQQKETA
ncbi:MAG: hypothetical protein FWH07_01175 [Oscillospiraceae bacterium]|nr:hypothetical protein [Oscillospiraceae bacterium]